MKSPTDLYPNLSSYYPFGMPMLNRQYGASYRFGFNGKEQDNEVEGMGDILDFGSRIYDPRLGRWLSLDPLQKKYPQLSPYQFAGDNPIFFIDIQGKELYAYDDASQSLVLNTIKYAFGSNNGFSFENNKLVYSGAEIPNLSEGQKTMLDLFTGVLINSKAHAAVFANEMTCAFRDKDGNLEGAVMARTDGATTGGVEEITTNSSGEVVKKELKVASVVPESIVKGGIDLMTVNGKKHFNAYHALLHELAHQIQQIMVKEFGGKYGKIDLTKMSDKQLSDFAIRYTNTLMESQKKPLETGAGQHKRDDAVAPPAADVKPLPK